MELLNQRAKRLAFQRGQSHITGIFDDGNQFLHLRRPLSDDQSELRTVAAKGFGAWSRDGVIAHSPVG